LKGGRLLIGANGAGKSTTLRSIAGHVKPESGKISYNGINLLTEKTDNIVKRGITLIPKGRSVFPNLTVGASFKRRC
jgi:branched-chain amino acid transport system ATP-binding protein